MGRDRARCEGCGATTSPPPQQQRRLRGPSGNRCSRLAPAPLLETETWTDVAGTFGDVRTKAPVRQNQQPHAAPAPTPSIDCPSWRSIVARQDNNWRPTPTHPLLESLHSLTVPRLFESATSRRAPEVRRGMASCSLSTFPLERLTPHSWANSREALLCTYNVSTVHGVLQFEERLQILSLFQFSP